MTDVINEVNVTETVLPIEDEVPAIQAAPATPKAKAKRVSKREPVLTEPEVKVTSSLGEVQADVVLPKQEPEVETKDACPDCGKQVSAKTLKYSHRPNCMSKRQKQSHEKEEYARLSGAAKQLAQDEGGVGGANALCAIEMLDSLNNVPEHVIRDIVQKRMTTKRTERDARREDIVQKLMQNAF